MDSASMMWRSLVKKTSLGISSGISRPFFTRSAFFFGYCLGQAAVTMHADPLALAAAGTSSSLLLSSPSLPTHSTSLSEMPDEEEESESLEVAVAAPSFVWPGTTGNGTIAPRSCARSLPGLSKGADAETGTVASTPCISRSEIAAAGPGSAAVVSWAVLAFFLMPMAAVWWGICSPAPCRKLKNGL